MILRQKFTLLQSSYFGWNGVGSRSFGSEGPKIRKKNEPDDAMLTYLGNDHSKSCFTGILTYRETYEKFVKCLLEVGSDQNKDTRQISWESNLISDISIT